MTAGRTWLARARALLAGRGADADLHADIQAHLDLLATGYEQRGFSPQAAREAARRDFGGEQQVREAYRDQRGWRWVDTTWQDVQYAVRTLRRSRRFATVSIVTLALGIGATTAIFSVMRAVLLRPLPYADGDRIVAVFETLRLQRGSASPGHFHDWSEQNAVFEATAAFQPATYNLADAAGPERVSGMRATPGIFRVAHIPPALGRYFTEQDLMAGEPVVVLSHALWQRRFGSDSSIVGREIRLGGEPHTVVGVAPVAYGLADPGRGGRAGALSPELWTPLVFSSAQRANYGNHSFQVLGKLKPGVTLDQAQADMERITRGIVVRNPQNMESRGVNVESLHEVLVAPLRLQIVLLMASVGFVMLIGCVNVASLLLARATTRRREIVVRAALGGGRRRIARQLLTESLVLALAGGIAAIGIAELGIRFLVGAAPASVPRLRDAGLQFDVLLFALLATVVAGLLFGLAPAVHASGQNLRGTLQEGVDHWVSSRARDRFRNVLVVVEMAIAVVLLVAAGLFIGSAARLQQVPLGFADDHVLTARVAFPVDRYREPEAVTDTYGRMLEHVRASTGVLRAGASTTLPMAGNSIDARIIVEGRTFAPGPKPSPHIRLITEEYFEAAGVPLRRGRLLQPPDMLPGAPPVLIINERLSSIVWPDEDPLGKRISAWTSGPEPEWREIVGVVGDVRTFGQDEPVEPEAFLPYTQAPVGAWDAFERSMAFVVRTAGNPEDYARILRGAVWSIDPSLPLYDLQTMDQLVTASTAPQRFRMQLFSLLAAIALVLAAVGVYGVSAYFVTQRTREIGIRMALGAQRADVMGLVVRQSSRLTVVGIGLGLAGAAAATRYLEGLLFELTPLDPTTFISVAIVFAVVATLASYVPARRATRLAPLVALRHE